MQRLLLCLAFASLAIAGALSSEYRWPTEAEIRAAKHPHDISHMAPKYFNFNKFNNTSLERGDNGMGVVNAVFAGICLVPYLSYCALCSTVLLFAQPFCGPQFVWACWVCGIVPTSCIKGNCNTFAPGIFG